MEIYGIIYKTTCLVNGKIYIGQTIHYEDENYLGSGTLLLKAVKKYGRELFIRETLKICYNQNQLDAWELVMIKRFNSTDLNIGYNILKGSAVDFGHGSCSKIPYVRKKISESLKGKFVGDKNPNYGHYWTDEMKEKVSKRKSGVKIWSDEQKKKMSFERKGRFAGEKNPMYGKKKTIKQKEKIGKSVQKYFEENPEVLISIGKSLKKFWKNADEEWKKEHFKKISEKKKKKVIVFSPDLSFLNVYDSFKEADCAIGKKGVSSVIRGKSTHVNGLFCRVYDDLLYKRLLRRKRLGMVIKYEIGFNGKMIILEEL